MNVPRSLVRWSLALVVVGIVGGIVCLTALVEGLKKAWLRAARAFGLSPLRRDRVASGMPGLRTKNQRLAVAPQDLAWVLDMADEADRLASFAEFTGEIRR